ncbi:hypothetical protein BU15DRAFT_74250 [Melanogaster broomeanus]|nr:hypothetical protein BU15DRAFT_74250 [Melanogaster broomeanus]
MVLSLLTRRLTLGATAVLAARVALPAPFSVWTRRTFLTTTPSQFPAAKTSKATATTTKKAASTKTSKKAATPSKSKKPVKTVAKKRATAKAGRPAKEIAKEEEKPKVRILKKELPPKRPAPPYFAFLKSYLMGRPKANTMEECRGNTTRAAEIWRGLSMTEKQPFYDESNGMMEQYYNDRDEYFRKTSLSTLKDINKRRQAGGKNRIVRVPQVGEEGSYLISPSYRYMSEFRRSPDGQAIMSNLSNGRSSLPAVAKAAGERWHSMSVDEKAPYFKLSKKSQEEYKAEKAEAATA